MSTDPRDEALDRLRAADPGAEATPDLQTLQAAVDARRSTPERGEPQPAGRPDPHAPDELASRRIRRRAPWLVAAVGALVFTAGGYALGVSGASVPGLADAAAGEEMADAPAQDGAAEPGFAVPGAPPSETDAELLSYPSGQRTVFTASGLGAQDGTAHAYGLDPGATTAERVTQIAQALGMSGEPTEQDGIWSLGSYDSGEPVLRVHADGTLDYSNPTLDPWRCEALAEEQESGGESGAGSSGFAGCAESSGSAPPEGEATQQLQEVLIALGLDPDDYAVTADGGTEGPLAYVTAELLVDGEPTGVTIAGGISSGGVANLWGSLAAPYDLGAYDVVSPQEAVQRLMDPRFGGTSSDVMPMEIGDVPLTPESETRDVPEDVDPQAPVEAPTTAPPELADPGAPIAWPVRQVTITDAQLGLQTLYTDAGQVLLVPTYTLTGADTEGEVTTWTVIALADAHLDQN